MIYLNKKKPKKFMIIGAAALALVILIFIVGTTTSWGKNIFGTVTSPVQGFFNSVGSSVGGAIREIFTSSDANTELNSLRERVASLESENASLWENKTENERLAKLLSLQDVYAADEYKAGRVIAKTDGTWFDEFTINIGSASGVEKDMPVVNGKGLIGRIYEVGINWSTVISVVDGRSAVSVLIERTRDIGVVKGDLVPDMIERTLSVEYLPHQADIMPGDRVITSGLGRMVSNGVMSGGFPKGLLVGEVVESGRRSDESVFVTVNPVDDFKHLEEVLVLITKPEPLLTEQTE